MAIPQIGKLFHLVIVTQEQSNCHGICISNIKIPIVTLVFHLLR